MLEGAGLPYEAHRVEFAHRDQHSAEFLLAGRQWLMGDAYGIADIAVFPWVRNLVGFYAAGELMEFERFANVQRVLEAFLAHPAVIRGLQIPGEQ